MKEQTRLLLAITVMFALLGGAQAAPPGKQGIQIRDSRAKTVEDIRALKKGDRYVLVCLECESATVKKVEDTSEVEALCHDGGKIHCDSCEKDISIKRVGPPGKKRAVKIIVKYLNDEGKECMLLIPLKE